MIHSTATVPVNPAGQTPLSHEQAWAGLVLKARDARLLPPGLCTRCDVVEEVVTHLAFYAGWPAAATAARLLGEPDATS